MPCITRSICNESILIPLQSCSLRRQHFWKLWELPFWRPCHQAGCPWWSSHNSKTWWHHLAGCPSTMHFWRLLLRPCWKKCPGLNFTLLAIADIRRGIQFSGRAPQSISTSSYQDPHCCGLTVVDCLGKCGKSPKYLSCVQEVNECCGCNRRMDMAKVPASVLKHVRGFRPCSRTGSSLWLVSIWAIWASTQ